MAKTPKITNSDKNPLGMVVQSILTETQFQAINGTGWIIMDGRSVIGSQLWAITNTNTIPDARGLVLRGKNNGRTDGAQNPDGELFIGTYQADQFKSHDHGGGNHTHSSYAGTGAFNPASAGGGLQAFTPVQTGASGAIIPLEGANETRMRSITVNHFIKINNA
jgi:hypothetical protein